MRTKNNKGRFHRIGTLRIPDNLSAGEYRLKLQGIKQKFNTHKGKCDNTLNKCIYI